LKQIAPSIIRVGIVYNPDNPNSPGKKYNTSWFDTWRFVDGKADEHWDPATITARPPPAPK